MITLSKNIILYALVLVLTNAITAYSVSSSPHEIKYVDPDNNKNHIIFVPDSSNPNKGSFDLVREKGESFGGTYTESSEAYNLDFPSGYRIEKKGNTIKMPAKYWVRS